MWEVFRYRASRFCVFPSALGNSKTFSKKKNGNRRRPSSEATTCFSFAPYPDMLSFSGMK
jgi:hypothetical protein